MKLNNNPHARGRVAQLVRSRRSALAGVASVLLLSSCADTTSAPSLTSAPSPTSVVSPTTVVSPTIPSSSPAFCADGVELKASSSPQSLNDRCELTTPAAIAGFVPSNTVMMEVDCDDDTSVWIAAERGVLLVSSSVPVADVVSALAAKGISVIDRAVAVGTSNTVFVVPVGNVIDAAFVTNTIPTLQGVGYRVDLNYLEPVLPQNGFRTDDDPLPAAAPPVEPGVETDAGSGKRILVIDSPLAGVVAPISTYPNAGSQLIASPPLNVSAAGIDIDIENNGFTDEDHSHGLFVASLIKRLAPGAEVTLQGVDLFADAGARPTPMWFSDAALIDALDTATATAAPFDAVNLSLGGAGCATHANRLALGDYLGTLVMSNKVASIISAAGNDATSALHFPAAFASPMWWSAATAKISGAVNQAASDDFATFARPMMSAMVSVGSSTNSMADCFSNHGAWVTAWAGGSQQVSRYQTPAGDVWASWSGTSFAAARVTAAKATNATIDAAPKDLPTQASCS